MDVNGALPLPVACCLLSILLPACLLRVGNVVPCRFRVENFHMELLSGRVGISTRKKTDVDFMI
jgi:hypothetical protein